MYKKLLACSVLLSVGADVHAMQRGACEKGGQSDLMSAIIYNDLPTVKLLVEHDDVDVGLPTGYVSFHSFGPIGPGVTQSFLHLAATREEGDVSELVTFLLTQSQLTVSARDYKDNTPLHRAQLAQVVQTLVEHGADVHATNGVGRTPLHKAVKRVSQTYRSDTADFGLLLHGASLTVRDNTGQTPLHRLSLKKLGDGGCPKVLQYVQSPQGIVDDEWHKINGRVFMLWCCLKRLGRMPRDVRQMLGWYTVCAETDGSLYDQLSVGQLGELVEGKLLSQKIVVDTLVERHFDTVGMALSTEDNDRNTPRQLCEKRVANVLNSEPYERSLAWLDPAMTELKGQYTSEIRQRYQRVLNGLPQEEGRVEQVERVDASKDEGECVIC